MSEENEYWPETELTRREIIWDEGRTYHPDYCFRCVDYPYCKEEKQESTNPNPQKIHKKCFISKKTATRDSIKIKEKKRGGEE